jgi:hypothetical protein
MLTLIRRANVIRIRLERFLVRPHLSAWVFFVILSLVMLYPLSLHLNDAAVDKADPLLNAWILAWDARTLASRPLALFDANIFYPYSGTLAYSETLLGIVPFSTPIIWLTGNPLLTVNLLCFFSFVLSGWGAYALVYRFTHEGWAGLVAGVVFAFAPYRFAQISRLQLVTAQWIPLAFLFLDRLIERHAWRDLALFTLLFNLQVLSSYYYGLFIAVSLAVLLIGYWLTHRQAINRKLCFQLVVFGLVTLAINVPLVLPYFTVARAMDFQRTFEDAVRGGADLVDFITVPPENGLYGALTTSLREGWWYERVLFPGLSVVGLAVIGVAGYLRRPRPAEARAVIQYVLLLVVSAILALGPALRLRGQVLFTPLPYTLLFQYVPGFRGLRQPARFEIMVALCLSVLAGYGVACLARRANERWSSRFVNSRAVLGSLATGLIVAEYISIPVPFVTMPVGGQIPAVYQWLAQQPGDIPILELPLRLDLREIEGARLYYSTFHWKQLVNGYSGWYTPVYFKLIGLTQGFPNEPSLRWIAGIGTQYVIVHRWQMTHDELAELDAHLGDYAGCLAMVKSFDDDQVYQVLQPLTGKPTTRGWRVGTSIALLGYWLQPQAAHPGDELSLSLFWQRKGQAISHDYTVFTHVLNTDGTLVTQHDGPPTNNDSIRPTSSWTMDKVTADEHRIHLPSDLPPGRYEVRAGMYLPSTMERLSISTLQGDPMGDSVPLGWLTVTSGQHEQ